MGKFVRNIEIEREFDGDQVKFLCKPMDKKTALTLYGFKKEKAFADDGITPVMNEKTGKQAETLSPEAVKFLTTAFEEHVESVSGVRDSAGNALDKAAVFEAAYFFGLTTEAAVEWSSRSLAGNQ